MRRKGQKRRMRTTMLIMMFERGGGERWRIRREGEGWDDGYMVWAAVVGWMLFLSSPSL